MTHKFKLGDIVRCRSIPEFEVGEITCDNLSYKTIDGDIARVYEVKIGHEIKHILEDGLEKIEKSAQEEKYNVGDRVVFLLGIKECIGIIKRIFRLAGNFNYIVEPLSHIGISYDIMENHILNKIEESNVKDAYKVGDRVYFYRADNGQTTTGVINVINQIRSGKYADIYEYFIRLDNDEDDKPIDLQWIEQTNVHCLYEERHFIPKKYKIGDRVIFYFTPDHVKIGVIEEIDTNNTYKVKVLFGSDYYILSEKDIICKSEIEKQKEPLSEEFKEGDEVWVKGIIEKWDGDETLEKTKQGQFKITLAHEEEDWIAVKPEHLFKSIPPKNEWISVKDKLPQAEEYVIIYTNSNNYFHARFCHNDNIFKIMNSVSILPLSKVSHWKPIDAPPE